MIFRYLYTIFLGILLALFVGIGIVTFYPQPQSPQVTPVMPVTAPEKGATPDPLMQQKAYQQELDQQKQFDTFQIDLKVYNRNVSIVALVAAVVYLLVSFFLLSQFPVWSDGFLLGGLFTLIYSIVCGFNSDDSRFRFIMITVSLVIVMVVGWAKFVRLLPKSSRRN